jgi:hypothetical protein
MMRSSSSRSQMGSGLHSSYTGRRAGHPRVGPRDELLDGDAGWSYWMEQEPEYLFPDVAVR